MTASINHILCTGGYGFVGQWLHRTQPSDILATYQNHFMYDGDWDQGDYDAIVHLAPVSPARVLAYAQKHHTRVLYASSGAIYDRQDEYSYNKRLWEADCKASGADVVIARPFCFVGEYLPLDKYSIGQFILDGLKGGPIRYYDIGCVRSYMYGSDLGDWLWKILLDGKSGEAYDIGGSEAVSMRLVARTVADVCKCAYIENLTPETDKPLVYLPNIAKARLLGCVETIGLKEAIERTVRGARR